MTDTEEQGSKAVSISGMHVRLANGAEVWGGFHDDSVVWRFTSPSGAVTRLALSRPAMSAVFQLYQDLLGSDFMVAMEAPPQADTSETARKCLESTSDTSGESQS